MKNINEKIKKFCNYKKSIYIIAIVTIILGLLLEVLIGTHLFKTNNYKKTIKSKDFVVSTKKDSFNIKLNDIDKFINTLKLDLDFESTSKWVECSVYYYDSKNNRHFIQKNNLGMIDTFDPVLKVGYDVKSIELKFNFNYERINVKSIMIDGRYDFNIIRFLAIIISIYLVLDVIRYIYLDKKPKLHLYFLKISLIVGGFYAIATPFFYSLDEQAHLIRAYNVSKLNIIQRNDELVNWPEKLNVFIDNPVVVAFPKTYNGFKNKISWVFNSSNSKVIKAVHNSTAITYLLFAYLISGLGMFFAHILGLNFVFSYYFGKIFNIVFCSILLSLAVKYSGKYNKIFFLLGLLPFILFQNASFSADAVTNSFAFLSIALTLYYKDEKKNFSYKDWFILLICYIMSFSSKIAYFPIGVLIFMIPNKKFKNKKIAYILKFITIFACLALFCIGTIYANKMGIVQWSYSGANSSLQLQNIIHNPFIFPLSIFNTLNEGFISMFFSLFYLGNCGYYGNLALVVFVIELIVVIASSKNNSKLYDKLIIVVYIILSICSSMGALYLSSTKVGKVFVDGYQGRYLVPILIPFFLLFVSNKFKLDIDENKIIYFILIIYVMFYIIGFFAFYINKLYY